jgi:hypothetical protein
VVFSLSESVKWKASGEEMDGLGSSCTPPTVHSDDSLEGVLTVVIASLSPMLVKNWPKTAKFLTEDERARVISRLRRDMDDLEDKFEWKYVFQAFKNFKMYIMVVIYLGANCSTYAIAFFLPTIISGLGYSAATYTP